MHLSAFARRSTKVTNVGDTRSPCRALPNQRMIGDAVGQASGYVLFVSAECRRIAGMGWRTGRAEPARGGVAVNRCRPVCPGDDCDDSVIRAIREGGPARWVATLAAVISYAACRPSGSTPQACVVRTRTRGVDRWTAPIMALPEISRWSHRPFGHRGVCPGSHLCASPHIGLSSAPP